MTVVIVVVTVTVIVIVVVIVQHTAPVKCCRWIADKRYLITGSWDQSVRCWDLRTPPTPVAQVAMGERVYAMDCKFPVMVCGMAEAMSPTTRVPERKLAIFDLNDPTRPVRVRDCFTYYCLSWGQRG